MPELTVPPPGDGDPRFNVHLLADVDRVLQDHGYDASNGGQLIELQLHLFHFLHGEDPATRCLGGVR